MFSPGSTEYTIYSETVGIEIPVVDTNGRLTIFDNVENSNTLVYTLHTLSLLRRQSTKADGIAYRIALW